VETSLPFEALRRLSESDPDLPYGKGAPNPRLVFPNPTLRLTVYTSEGDKALSVSEWLMGSLRRLGRVNQASLSKEQLAKSRAMAGFATFIPLEEISRPFWKISPARSASD
jgi:hypothetical protein